MTRPVAALAVMPDTTAHAAEAGLSGGATALYRLLVMLADSNGIVAPISATGLEAETRYTRRAVRGYLEDLAAAGLAAVDLRQGHHGRVELLRYHDVRWSTGSRVFARATSTDAIEAPDVSPGRSRDNARATEEDRSRDNARADARSRDNARAGFDVLPGGSRESARAGQLASYSYAQTLWDHPNAIETNQELASCENATPARGPNGERTEDHLRDLLAPLLELPGAKLTDPSRASSTLAALADAQVTHGAREEARRIVARREAGQKVGNPIGWFLGLAGKPDTATRLFPTVEALAAAGQAVPGPWATGGGTPDPEAPQDSDQWHQRALTAAVAEARVMASDPGTTARAALDTLAHTHQADPDISAAAAEAYLLERGTLVAAGTVPPEPTQAVAS